MKDKYQVRIKKFSEITPKDAHSKPMLIDTTYLAYYFNGVNYVLLENYRLNDSSCFVTSKEVCNQLVENYKEYLETKIHPYSNRYTYSYEFEVFKSPLSMINQPVNIASMLNSNKQP